MLVNRFSRSLYILLSSGVNMIEAIEISAKVMDNDFIDEKISTSIEYLIKGYRIKDALSVTNIFPNLFLSMISVGEESGRLDDVLETMSKFYDGETDRVVEKFMRMLEPCIMIVIGIIVGGGIIAMITPMFELINSI